MANRSHLYTLSADPRTTATDDLKINGLTEYNYNIPRAQFIFASSNPFVMKSFLFDGDLAIVADYAEGKERLLRYLDLLDATGQMNNHEQFHKYAEETKSFLALPENQGTHVLLEAGEIYALSVDTMQEMEQECREWAEAMDTFGKRLDELLNLNIPPAELLTHDWVVNDKQYNYIKNAPTKWEENLGIDWWTNILYYSFSK